MKRTLFLLLLIAISSIIHAQSIGGPNTPVIVRGLLKLTNPEFITLDNGQVSAPVALWLNNNTPSTEDIPVQMPPIIVMQGTGWNAGMSTSSIQSLNWSFNPDGTDMRPFLNGKIVIDGVPTSVFRVTYPGVATVPVAYGVTSGPTIDTTGVIFLPRNTLTYTTGTNSTVGSANLSSGTVTVNTTSVHTGDIIFLTGITTSTPCATCGNLSYGNIVNNTSFVIYSSLNTDSRTVNYVIAHTQ